MLGKNRTVLGRMPCFDMFVACATLRLVRNLLIYDYIRLIVAVVRFEVSFDSDAEEQMKRAPRHVQTEIAKLIEATLEHQPTHESKSRIKRLREIDHPQFRLRVGDWRIYYDVDSDNLVVDILAILPKDQSVEYLERCQQKL